MKSVMISIQPKWCELIASGKKTVEVRKTSPKIATPFKVYIYATNPKKWFRFSSFGYASDECLWVSNGKVKMCDGFEFWAGDTEYQNLNGKVIGEFVCDRIIDIPYSQYFVDYYHTMPQDDLDATCLNLGFIDEYLLSKSGYGWHISDLVIYDKPKELNEFARFCDGISGKIGCRGCEYYYEENDESQGHFEMCGCDNVRPITRPFQSWGYVEERNGND